MDEYTPTTGQVRNAYAWQGYDESGSPSKRDYDTFDRWLAEHDRMVAANAWDEGFAAAVNYDMGDYEHPPEEYMNPYRITEEDTNGR